MNFNIFDIRANEYNMKIDVGKVVEVHSKKFVVKVELHSREGFLEDVRIMGSYKPNVNSLGLLFYIGNFNYPHFLPLYSGNSTNIYKEGSYVEIREKTEVKEEKSKIDSSNISNVKTLLQKTNVKIYVFGDSHIKGALGVHLGKNFKNINSNCIYKRFGIDGAGFMNSFKGNKTTLINNIKDFNPDIVFCFLGTNDIASNSKVFTQYFEKFFTLDFDKYNIVLISTPYYNVNNGETFTTQLGNFASVKGYGFINIFKSDMTATHTDKWHYTDDGYKTIANYITDQL